MWGDIAIAFLLAFIVICILRMWIATEFEGGRHQERVDLIRKIETENMK